MPTISMSDGNGGLRACAGHHQAAHAIVGQKLGAGRQPPAGVDDDPRRLRAGDAPHRELRIVGQRGSDPDHHRVHQGAQPMQMGEPRRPIDVVGMSGFGRNPAVQRLADLRDHHQFIDPPVPQRPEQLLPRAPAAGRSAPETLRERGSRNPYPDCLWPGSSPADAATGRRCRQPVDEIRDDGTLTCHNTLLPDEGDMDQWLTGMGTPVRVF